MKILISNDDGVFAPGILAAKQAVEDLADVTVVAPDKNNSSVGRRLTLFKHLELKSCELEDESLAYSVSGSPADCIIVGSKYVMDEKPDLVIVGLTTIVRLTGSPTLKFGFDGENSADNSTFDAGNHQPSDISAGFTFILMGAV